MFYQGVPHDFGVLKEDLFLLLACLSDRLVMYEAILLSRVWKIDHQNRPSPAQRPFRPWREISNVLPPRKN